jgi:hypothetical protein
MNKIYNKKMFIFVSVALVLTLPASAFSMLEEPPVTIYSPYYPPSTTPTDCYKYTESGLACLHACELEAGFCWLASGVSCSFGPFCLIGMGGCVFRQNSCEAQCEPPIQVPCPDAGSPPSKYIK